MLSQTSRRGRACDVELPLNTVPESGSGAYPVREGVWECNLSNFSIPVTILYSSESEAKQLHMAMD